MPSRALDLRVHHTRNALLITGGREEHGMLYGGGGEHNCLLAVHVRLCRGRRCLKRHFQSHVLP